MKVGIVGYGSIGQRHADNASTLGHQVFVYDPACRGRYVMRNGSSERSDVKFERDIYDTCDAVVIATPSPVHIAGIRACIERGRHMLVEKPIATSDQGLRELLDRAAVVYASFSRDQKLVVMMGNNLRFHPCVKQVGGLIDVGGIGHPIWASFTCAALSTNYLSDGVILNTGAHEVDLALHLLGPAKVVSANAHVADYGGVREPMREDIADFVLEHASGCRSTFHLDFVTKTEIREFRVIGHDGDLRCDLLARTIRARLADPKLTGVVHTHDFKGNGTYDTDYLDEMRAFFDQIEGKDVPGATGDDGFATLQVLLDVRKMAGLA